MLDFECYMLNEMFFSLNSHSKFKTDCFNNSFSAFFLDSESKSNTVEVFNLNSGFF